MSLPDLDARAEIVVDLDAIAANVATLKARAGVAMMTVVKADGYGHGLVEAGRAARAGGADWLGTAVAEEALALRAAGDTGRILTWLAVPGEDYIEQIPDNRETPRRSFLAPSSSVSPSASCRTRCAENFQVTVNRTGGHRRSRRNVARGTWPGSSAGRPKACSPSCGTLVHRSLTITGVTEGTLLALWRNPVTRRIPGIWRSSASSRYSNRP